MISASIIGISATQAEEVHPGLFRVGQAGSVAIDRHGVCRVVKNEGTSPILVPTGTGSEWHVGAGAFLQNVHLMDKISVSSCALPMAGYSWSYAAESPKYVLGTWMEIFADSGWDYGSTKYFDDCEYNPGNGGGPCTYSHLVALATASNPSGFIVQNVPLFPHCTVSGVGPKPSGSFGPTMANQKTMQNRFDQLAGVAYIRAEDYGFAAPPKSDVRLTGGVTWVAGMNSWTYEPTQPTNHHREAVGDAFRHYYSSLNIAMPASQSRCYVMIGYAPGAWPEYPEGLLEGWVFHNESGPLY